MFFLTFSGRADRITGIYPVLMGGGSFLICTLINKIKAGSIQTACKTLIIVFLVIMNLGVIPIVCPVLPVDLLAKYCNIINLNKRVQSPAKTCESILPQLFAQSIGWNEFVTGVLKTYNGLSIENKKNIVIFSSDYGKCASIEVLGNKNDFPPVIGNHNNYYLWGYNKVSCETMMVLGDTWQEFDITKYYRDVKKIAVIDAGEYSVSYMRNVSIYLCKNPVMNIKDIWQKTRGIY